MTRATETAWPTLRPRAARRRYRQLHQATHTLARELERTITPVERANLLRRYAVVVTEMSSVVTAGWPTRRSSRANDTLDVAHQADDLASAARLVYMCADAETCRARHCRASPDDPTEFDKRPQGDPVLETMVGPALDMLATGRNEAEQLDSYGDIASRLARSSSTGEYTVRTAVALSQVSGDPLLSLSR